MAVVKRDMRKLMREKLYRSMRRIYWRLPIGVRRRLSPLAGRIRSRAVAPQVVSTLTSRSSDLDWHQFQSNILANKKQYKGIFIQGIVIDWNVELYQRPQHIANAFAAMDYLVIYSTANWAGDNVNGFRQVEKNIWLTNENLIGKIPEAVVSVYSTAYGNADLFMQQTNRDYRLVYEYIDHIDPKISGDADNISRLQALKDFAFGGGVDFIVASSDVLAREAVEAVGEHRVIVVKNGVDTSHYRRVRSPEELGSIEYQEFRRRYKKIVGYFGALAPWLWYDLINEVVNKCPDTGFVFIGPDYYGGSERIVGRTNVLCTGAIDYQNLPAYARDFDVCIIPFEPGEIARTTSPLKLFEYFALEKPVVVTSDMHECTLHEEVLSGGDVDEFVAALDKAFALKDDERFKMRLSALADENDWRMRALVYSKVFDGL